MLNHFKYQIVTNTCSDNVDYTLLCWISTEKTDSEPFFVLLKLQTESTQVFFQVDSFIK